MKHTLRVALACGLALSVLPRLASSQTKPRFVTPDSSIRRTGEAPGIAHTNIHLWLDTPAAGNGAGGETPASVACIYKFVTQVAGCPIGTVTQVPSGGAGAIALVDAYDYPTAAADLATFSAYYNLPSASFQVVYASGSKPSQDSSGGWEAEAALDIEWAHAMAPKAKIYLIEAASSSTSDLLAAVQTASLWVANAGGGAVSMSFAGSESSSELADDQIFTTAGIVYVAATGDTPFVRSYPAMSPNVIAAGGTTIVRDGNGNYTGQTYWDADGAGGGGGISSYEAIPRYQAGIKAIVGTHRGVPDVAAIAGTGVSVYDSIPETIDGKTYPGGWIELGGTSVAAPVIAGHIDNVGLFQSSAYVLSSIYDEYASPSEYASYFYDVTQGNSNCKAGWDICAGIGSMLGDTILPVPNMLTPSETSVQFSPYMGIPIDPIPQTLTVTNKGSVAITGFSAGIGNSNSNFQVSSNCSSTIAVNASCTLSVSWDPASDSKTGEDTATLVLTSSAFNSPFSIPVSGDNECSRCVK